VQDQSLSLRRAQSAKPRAPLTWIVFPSARQRDGLEIGDRFDLVRVAAGAVKNDRASPPLPAPRDVVRVLQRFEPGVHVAYVIDKTISPARRLSGPTHANQIGRQAPTMWTDMGNDVSPLI